MLLARQLGAAVFYGGTHAESISELALVAIVQLGAVGDAK
jgi:hypothetical protein